MQKRRAMKPDAASRVKQAGHRDERTFARLIKGKILTESPQPKADVIDRERNTFSVKSGAQKWQIFLYGRNRLDEDAGFGAINGIGKLLVRCIDAFPETLDDYRDDKPKYKKRLRAPMRAVRQKLSRPQLLRGFFHKSLFNDRVEFLAVKNGDIFHVFHKSDVLDALCEHVTAVNSQAHGAHQTPEQKVVFKFGKPEPKTLGEIEMRNDSKAHYKEVKFWMHKEQTLLLLVSNITPCKKHPCGKIILHGSAIEKLS